MNYSETKGNAAKIVTLETAIAERYRTLQSKLKDFQEKKIVYLQVKLNSSFAVLKAEAERIIESYRLIAETQDAIETVEQKTDEVLASLPTRTITQTSDFADLTSNTEIPQDATATMEQKLETEAEIYKAEFEAVIASLPVSTVVTNRDFASKKVFVTEQQTMWLSKKTEYPSDIIILKVSNLSAIAYAGDALRLVAILGTCSLVEGGTLKTHIPMLDLEGVLHKAKKKGFNIKVSDADQTVVLSEAS